MSHFFTGYSTSITRIFFLISTYPNITQHTPLIMPPLVVAETTLSTRIVLVRVYVDLWNMTCKVVQSLSAIDIRTYTYDWHQGFLKLKENSLNFTLYQARISENKNKISKLLKSRKGRGGFQPAEEG